MTAAFTLAAASAFAADPSTAGRAVLALDQTWADAESRSDIAAVRPILDERFLATFDASKPLGRTEFLKAVFGGEPAGTEVQTLSERTVVVAGQTAVALKTDTVASKRPVRLRATPIGPPRPICNARAAGSPWPSTLLPFLPTDSGTVCVCV